MFRISDLRNKDIVNMLDGKKIGFTKDIELDLGVGRITAIILPGEGRLFGIFGRSEDIIIGWDQIQKIGIDVIMVEMHTFTPTKKDKDDDIPSHYKKKDADLAPYDERDHDW